MQEIKLKKRCKPHEKSVAKTLRYAGNWDTKVVEDRNLRKIEILKTQKKMQEIVLQLRVRKSRIQYRTACYKLFFGAGTYGSIDNL